MKSHFNCKFDLETERKIVREYVSGTSTTELGSRYGVCHGTIGKILDRHHVKRRTRSEAFEQLSNARKHQFDEHFFDRIDREQKAYLIGLLYADGWMQPKTYGTCLSSTDRELIEMFQQALATSHPIRLRYPPAGKDLHEITVNSKVLYHALLRQGCHPNKSLTLEFPRNVPGDLLHHFIRGYWDGDGSIRLDRRGNLRATVAGTHAFLSGMQRALIASIPIKPVTLINHGNIYRLDYSGNWTCFLLRLYLYKGATMYLQRKKEIWFSTLPSNRRKRLGQWGRQVLASAHKHPEFPIEPADLSLA